jgi:hypothetical protein
MNASLSYASRELLRAMERVIPWAQLTRALSPTYPEVLRQCLPGGEEALARCCLLRQWLNLSIPELVELAERDAEVQAFARWNDAWGSLSAETLERPLSLWFGASRALPVQEASAPAAILAAFVGKALDQARLCLQKTPGGAYMLMLSPEHEYHGAKRKASESAKREAPEQKKAEAEKAKRKAHHWRLLRDVAILYGIELLLALLLNAAWVGEVSPLVLFASAVERIAPVVGNFDRIARYPEGLRVMLAITIMLFPLKVWLAYRWFAGSGNAYRQFVVSPLSRQKDLTPRDFIRDAGEMFRERDASRQRSWFAIVFASIMILALALMTMFVIFVIFAHTVAAGEPETLPSLGEAKEAIAHGGFSLWWTWCVSYLTVCSLVVAAAVCVLRDWRVFLFPPEKRNHSS